LGALREGGGNEGHLPFAAAECIHFPVAEGFESGAGDGLVDGGIVVGVQGGEGGEVRVAPHGHKLRNR